MDIYGSFCLLVTFQKEDQIFLTKVNTLILNHILLKQLNKKKIFFSSKVNIIFKLHFCQTIEQKKHWGLHTVLYFQFLCTVFRTCFKPHSTLNTSVRIIEMVIITQSIQSSLTQLFNYWFSIKINEPWAIWIVLRWTTVFLWMVETSNWAVKIDYKAHHIKNNQYKTQQNFNWHMKNTN